MTYKTLPVVSFFKVLQNTKRILENPLPFHNENFEKHGDCFRVILGYAKDNVVFTRDAGLAKHMLQKQHKKYHKSKLQSKELARYIGEGLLTANGQKWLRQRRLIQPAFHKKKLESLIGTMKEVIDQQLQKIKPNQEIDVFPVMNDLAFKVVARALFSYAGDEKTISRLQHITETAQKTLIKEIRQPYKRWWFYLSGKVKSTLRLTQEARDILNGIIEERKRSSGHHDDLLDMLLNSTYEDGTKMDNEQLIDEILILFTAGHETTSNALSFTLQLLAHHPEIQDKVYQEILDLKDDQYSLMEKITKLQYTKQCVEESMRLYPPAYFSDRLAIEDDEYMDLQIPKGSTILISFYEIHRHKELWQNPNQFDPDRFDPKIDKKTYADCYYPFGAGPRMCIGNNFAMYEMIMTITELVEKYRIRTSQNEIKIKPLITLKPANSRLKFESRG